MAGRRICWGRWAFAGTMLVLALLAASCASPAPDEATGVPPAAEVTATPTSLPSVQEGQEKGGGEEEGPRVPAELRFTAPALAGGTIRGVDLAGSDLVIWFWAPW